MIKWANKMRQSLVDKMIKSALDNNIAIDKFVRETRREQTDRRTRENLESAYLTAEDWDQLIEVHKVLEPFQTITLNLQSKSYSLFSQNPGDGTNRTMDVSIVNVFPALSKLLNHLEDEYRWLRKLGGCVTLIDGIDAGWRKLNKC